MLCKLENRVSIFLVVSFNDVLNISQHKNIKVSLISQQSGRYERSFNYCHQLFSQIKKLLLSECSFIFLQSFYGLCDRCAGLIKWIGPRASIFKPRGEFKLWQQTVWIHKIDKRDRVLLWGELCENLCSPVIPFFKLALDKIIIKPVNK